MQLKVIKAVVGCNPAAGFVNAGMINEYFLTKTDLQSSYRVDLRQRCPSV